MFAREIEHPKISITYMLLCTIVAILSYPNIIKTYDIYFDRVLIFKKGEVRVLLNFSFGVYLLLSFVLVNLIIIIYCIAVHSFFTLPYWKVNSSREELLLSFIAS